MSNRYFDYEVAVQLIANKLCNEFDLKPVRVEIDGRLVKRYGAAVYQTRQLRLSPKLLEHPDELNNTLRHEIAHFLAYDKYRATGHGRVWKECAVKLGARPNRYEAWKDSHELNGTRYIYDCGDGCKAPATRIKPRYEKGICAKHGNRFTRTRVQELI